ncbi:odorant receptor coreceptor-like [Chelonus insularis]|uniref:odorant receptor coreceptor-like n=1 Tax=Chelonus insularis TaxID=460826 RepID=UPI00158E6FF0|nr:odorant receptor coreceptor-like [Chelonus insularis]
MTGILCDISYNLKNVSNQDDRIAIVRQCLVQYSIVLKCRDKLQRIYGPIILWTMGTNAILLCGVAFQITHLQTVSTARIILFIVHGGMKTIQIFMYNWAGSRLTEESEIYRTALYTSNWLENKKLMKIIAIALGQKPLIVKACSYLIVSLDMFVYVMNATASYFVFLQTMEIH